MLKCYGLDLKTPYIHLRCAGLNIFVCIADERRFSSGFLIALF